MADFEAPSGPPPPKVPEGWVARWNDQYHEWFYVNTYTKKSQWDKPTAPAVDPNSDAPAGPPPGYTPGATPTPSSDAKTNPFVNAATKPGGPSSESEDERLARQLQEEENARAASTAGTRGGAADSYMNNSSPAPGGQSSYPSELPPRPDGSGGDKSRGLLGKIFGGGNKNKYPAQGGGFPGAGGGGYGSPGPQQYSSPGPQQYGGYGSPGPQQYGGYGSPGPQQYGGYGPPPGQYGGYGGPPAGYGGGGYGAPGYGPPGGGYGQPAYYQQGRPQKSGGGGMGAMGGAALGVGAGMLGGAMIANAIDDREDEAYAEGYNDGQDGDDFDGGDF